MSGQQKPGENNIFPSTEQIKLGKNNLKSQLYSEATINQILDVVTNNGLNKEGGNEVLQKLNYFKKVFGNSNDGLEEYLNTATPEQLNENQLYIQQYLRNVCKYIFVSAIQNGETSNNLTDIKRDLGTNDIYDEGTIAWVNKLVNAFNQRLKGDDFIFSRSSLSGGEIKKILGTKESLHFPPEVINKLTVGTSSINPQQVNDIMDKINGPISPFVVPSNIQSITGENNTQP